MSNEKVNYDHVDDRKADTPPQSSSVAESGVDLAYEKRIIRKVDLRLLPILGALYSVALIDRANMANAAIAGMMVDLKLFIGDRYSIALLMFFIPYFLFELPSNIVLRRVGSAVWLASIGLAWGAVMIGMGFLKDWRILVFCRVLLGFFEAGFFPGCVYLISSWYVRYEVQKRLAGFYLVVTLANAFSSILAYGLIQMNGIQGLSGWRWIFIIEGVITVAVAILAYFIIVDFPDKLLQRGKPFLSAVDIEMIKSRIDRDRGESEADPLTWAKVGLHLSDWKLWVYALMFMNAAVPAYALAYFLPIILRGMGYSVGMAQILSAPPYVSAVVIAFGLAWGADKTRLRAPFIATGCLLIIVGLSITAYSTKHSVRYFGIFLGLAGVQNNVPAVLAYQSNNIRMNSKRSVGTALQVGFGAIGGIFASTVFREKDSPKYLNGLWATMGCQFLTLLFLVCMSLYFKKKNRQHKKGTLDKPIEDHPAFTYTL
ncbi:MFS general substrate transporter [Choiromyces venosus 120613-1]|uniref:MFS general substrate transporter n=1 Tax=Choiromyces venosus 120613-1 TaxID=1336337 RepID=A0A3N4JMZ9_9PEZI|nr:MFS general substrate transporter [Choiromyces venosus 120613-1]